MSMIQFRDKNGIRRSLRLGRIPKHALESTRLRVKSLVAATIIGAPIDGETARWVQGVGDGLASKLAGFGLIPPRSLRTVTPLAELLDRYFESRSDVKPGTRLNWRTARNRLVKFFGADRSLDSIKPSDAADCAAWLKSKYALATAGRSIKLARQFLSYAIDAGLLERNPFAKIKAPGQVNRKRLFEVTHEMTASVIDACPNAEWRLIVALSRYGGLRCPSEHLVLTWADLDWERGGFLVRSPKKQDDQRWVPLFPELRPFLEASFELAAPGTVHVINRATNANLRTQFTRIIIRAGLRPWPRLFHNLRASRQTELAATYPLADVCDWLGNSPIIAAGHYLKPSEATFQNAALHGARCQSAAAPRRLASHGVASTCADELGDRDFDAVLRGSAEASESVQDGLVSAEGFEPPTPSV